MSIYILLPAVLFTFCMGLLYLVIVSGLRHAARRPFSIFLVFMAFWGVFIFLMRITSSMTQAYFWEIFVFISIISASMFFYIFVLSVTNLKEQKWFQYLIYTLYACSVVLIPTGLVIKGMQMMWYGKAPVVGPLFFLYIFAAYVPIIRGMLLLIKHYRQTRALNEIVRDSYLIFGTMVMLVGGTTDFLPSLGIGMYPLGIIFNLVFCVVATISMLRYGLMEIRVVLRRAASYSLVSVVMLGIVIGIYLLVTNYIKGLSTPVSVAILAVGFLGVAAVFQPV